MTNTPQFKPVRKAVFPVAGLGTRFLPATKVMPKEMLTVGDKPLIQHAVEEARAAGIEEFIFVTGRNKEMLEEHFDHQVELMATLKARGKTQMVDMLQSLELPATALTCTRQPAPLGLGHAVWCASKIVGNEPFAVILADVVVQGTPGCLSQMMDVYQKVGGNVLALSEVPRSETHKYGIIDIKSQNDTIFKIKGMVEKPKPESAPSTLSITGRYILQPEVFTHLSAHERGAGNEIQLTDSMAKLIGTQPFHGVQFKGQDYDCGSRLGFIEANIAFGLADPTMKDDVRKILDKYL
jgi:UTP--glucose-1-phosphate uridylyltransferase